MREAFSRFLGIPKPAAPELRDESALREQVRRLEIRARQALRSGIAGEYQAAFKGRGLEFEEVREYRPGDDTRTIDWKVTARMGQPFIKLYREERDLTTLMLVDLSSSTRFGSGHLTVHDLIAEVSSLFILAASKRDRVGAVLFDEHLRSVIPPRRGWRHGLRVVRDILESEPSGNSTAFGEALEAAGRLIHRRGILVAVIDAACELPVKPLRAIAARHELVILRVHDAASDGRARLEAVLPSRDAEGRDIWSISRFDRLEIDRPPGGIDMVEIATDVDYLPAVHSMLEARERRRGR